MSLKKLKVLVSKRSGGNCEYCKCPAKYSTESFCMEHIIPKSKGGDDDLENLAFSCYGCNSHKYSKTEGTDTVTGENAPLFYPRKEEWNDNFAWNEDTTKMLGLTPTGRATVDILKLNRENLQNLRKLLYDAGEHPPNDGMVE